MPTQSPERRWPRILGVLALVGLAVAAYWKLILPPSSLKTAPGGPVAEAEAELIVAAGIDPAEYRLAAGQFYSRHRRDPAPADVYSFLGEQAVAEHRYETALVSLAQVPAEHPRFGHSARYQRGIACLELNRAAEAEAELTEFLRLEATRPQLTAVHHRDAMSRLAYLLGVELRFEDRSRLLADFARSGQTDTYHTLLYCYPTLLRWNGPDAAAKLEAFLDVTAGDVELQAAHAWYLASHGQLKAAESQLNACAATESNAAMLTGIRLYLLREDARWDEMAALVERLPAPTTADPWVLNRMRGHVHNHRREWEAAEVCFRIALQQDSASSEASFGLATALRGLGRIEEQERWLRRADACARIQNRLGHAFQRLESTEPIVEIANLSLQGELPDQAELVIELLARMDPQLPELPTLRDHLQDLREVRRDE